MKDTPATFVATCHPFLATPVMLEQRRLARAAKGRLEPEHFDALKTLVDAVWAAVLGFSPSPRASAAAWIGCADRLALAHPSPLLRLLRLEGVEDGGGRLEFVTVVGPSSYRPGREAATYRSALASLSHDAAGVRRASAAARALVLAARDREFAWSDGEWEYRLLAAITAWVYWDDEPGAARRS